MGDILNVRTKKKKYGAEDIYDVVDDTQSDIDGETLADEVIPKKKKKKRIKRADEYIEDEDNPSAEMTPNLGSARGKKFPTTSSTIKEKFARKKYLNSILEDDE